MPLADRARDVLRCKIKARAWSLLALIGKRLDRALTIKAGDGSLHVTITVAPTGDGPAGIPPADQFPGNHFSPLEASIYLSLAGGPLLGKVIANLVQRKALIHTDEGYARAPIANGKKHHETPLS